MKKSPKPKKKAVETVKKQVAETVSMDSFLDLCIATKKINKWQKPEIRAFFKDLNLKEKEDLDKYELSLKKY